MAGEDDNISARDVVSTHLRDNMETSASDVSVRNASEETDNLSGCEKAVTVKNRLDPVKHEYRTDESLNIKRDTVIKTPAIDKHLYGMEFFRISSFSCKKRKT